MRSVRFCPCLLAILCATAWGVQDPLAKDHMSNEMFMKAAWHMAIEDVSQSPGEIVVTTTGGTFAFAIAEGTIACTQRIGKEREAVTVALGTGALAGLTVKVKDTGAVILESAGGIVAKVNCDSLLMLRARSSGSVACELGFQEEVNYHVGSNRVWLDRFGVVGVYPIEKAAFEKDTERRDKPAYRLGEGGEIWICVGPPRPYPWEESVKLRPIWQGSWETPEQAVPSDDKIKGYAERGNLLWLQGEPMLWKSWQEAYEPRLPDELPPNVIRMARTLHKNGVTLGPPEGGAA